MSIPTKNKNVYLCYFLFHRNANENGKLMTFFIFFLSSLTFTLAYTHYFKWCLFTLAIQVSSSRIYSFHCYSQKRGELIFERDMTKFIRLFVSTLILCTE